MNATAATAKIVKIADGFRMSLNPAVLKAFRNDSHPGFRLAFIAAQAEQFLRDHVLPADMPDALKDSFLAGKPLALRNVTLLTRHALDWVIQGGLLGLPENKELNHLLDIEYALAASYFDWQWDRTAGGTDMRLPLPGLPCLFFFMVPIANRHNQGHAEYRRYP